MAVFLIDEDLPRSLGAALAAAGLRVVEVRDTSLRGKPDSEIRAFAVRAGMTLVSADLEFANPQIFPAGFPGGLILCRYPSESRPSDFAQIVAAQIAGLSDADLDHGIAVLEQGRIRLHKRQT